MRVLSGDIGGTKTWLSVYEAEGDGPVRQTRIERCPSADFPGLAPMVRALLGSGDLGIDRAAFGVAGPVVDDVCRATNLPWIIDGRALEKDLGIPRVRLLNDFHAIALGLSELAPDELVVLQEGTVDPDAPVALVGAGTGLGEAIVVPTPSGPRVLDSEGGHADFAPRNEDEIALLRFLLEQHHRVSYERVLSGPGLGALYRFVVKAGLAPGSEAVHQRFAAGEDGGAVVGNAAASGEDAAATRAVSMFVSVYGAEAGNLALKVLPHGGLYIAGGIAPRLLDAMRAGPFLQAFLDKGRMRPLLESIRVSVVTNTRVGLLGARVAALT